MTEEDGVDNANDINDNMKKNEIIDNGNQTLKMTDTENINSINVTI